MSVPKIVGPPRPEIKMGWLKKAIGKRITNVEFGEEKTHSVNHQAEVIILHFDDGSALSIQVGSNVQNLMDKFKKVGIAAQDISTDLIPFWVKGEENHV